MAAEEVESIFAHFYFKLNSIGHESLLTKNFNCVCNLIHHSLLSVFFVFLQPILAAPAG